MSVMEAGMKSKAVAAFGMLAALSCAATSVQLVRDGMAVAQIVVPETADATETFAAHEIQKWVGEITGAFVPVEKTASAKEGVPAEKHTGVASTRPPYCFGSVSACHCPKNAAIGKMGFLPFSG